MMCPGAARPSAEEPIREVQEEVPLQLFLVLKFFPAIGARASEAGRFGLVDEWLAR